MPRLLGSPFMAVFAVGVAWGVVASIVHLDWEWPFRSAGGGDTALAVIGWIVVLPLGWACGFALLALWRYRVVVRPDEVSARAVLRTRTVRLADADSITVVGGRPASTTAGPTFSRVDIRGRTPAGAKALASINSAFVTGDMAVPALLPWVRARPELVTDPVTRALFEGVAAGPAAPSAAER